MKVYRGSRDTVPLILNFGTIRRWMVNSGPDRFNSRKRPGKHWSQIRSNAHERTAGFRDRRPTGFENCNEWRSAIRTKLTCFVTLVLLADTAIQNFMNLILSTMLTAVLKFEYRQKC